MLKLRFNCDGRIFISFVFPQFTSFHSVKKNSSTRVVFESVLAVRTYPVLFEKRNVWTSERNFRYPHVSRKRSFQTFPLWRAFSTRCKVPFSLDTCRREAKTKKTNKQTQKQTSFFVFSWGTVTEWLGRPAPDLKSGGPGFKSRSVH